MRSAKENTTCMSCSMMQMVMSRSSLICFSRSMVLLVSARAIPAVGSSSKSRRGFCARHMPISSRRLLPRDMAAAWSWRASARFRLSSMCSACSTMSFSFVACASACMRKAPSRLAKIGIIMFSSTLRSPKISGVWNTREMPIWLIW
jgi:hypothetical protein